MLARLLTLKGHEVAVAHDGEEALAAAKAFHPEVVLLDIGMPKMDGYEVCREVRRLPGGAVMHLIALTGWGQEDDLARSREMGFSGHLVKPVEFRVVAELLDQLPA
jgi:CheY-like chemotaxis protein